MSILNKARRSDLIELCEECGINTPEKVTILSLIEAIKTWESYDEDFIKDRLEVISSASKEKRKLELEAQAEKEKEQRKIEAEKEKEQRKIEAEKEKEQRKIEAEKEKEERKIEAEKEKEEKRIALEERKLELEAGERRRQAELEAEERRRQAELQAEERRRQTELEARQMEIEEKKLMLEIEDREKMREFELKKLTMQAEIDSQKDVEIQAPRTGTGKNFDLLKLLNRFDSANGDICMFLTLYERQVSQMKIDKDEWVSYLLSLLPLEIASIITREKEPDVNNYEYIKNLLLKRFKMSPEEFRQRFMTHKKEPTDNWRDFGFQLKTYFNEWVRGMNVTTFDGLTELLVTDQIKRKIPPETRERFIEEFPRIKEVNVLVEKLDDFDTALRGFKTAKSYKAQNSVNREEIDSQWDQNAHRNNIGRGERAINSRIICYSCNLPGHIAAKCTNSNQMSTQEYSAPITKANENGAQKRNIMSLSKAENYAKSTKKIRVVPINEKPTKIIIDTASDVSLINEEYYTEIGAPELCQENLYILTGFGGEETEPIGYFGHEIQVDGVKLTDNFHVVSGLECDILLGVSAISGCTLTVTKEGVKIKNLAKEEHAKAAMAGLDLLARKSLERGSESSILISNSILGSTDSQSSQDHWSWRNLREQFCVKNAESLFEKYQSRLHHTMLILALTANVVSGVSAILLWSFFTDISSNTMKTPLILRTILTTVSLVLYIISYQERWFFSWYSRLIVSCFMLVLTTAVELSTSIHISVNGRTSSQRFAIYPLLSATIFLPFPRWYQVGIAATCVSIADLVIAALSYNPLSWRQMSADVVFYLSSGLMGLYIRFLMEFTNRKAFLDRRECFESKFHLQYEKDQEERLLLSVLPKHISVQVREGIRDVMSKMHVSPMPQRPFTELFVEKHKNVSILYADIVNSVVLTASLHVSELVETLNELFGRFDDCAEKNSCLRIKLLGDCYYCVSGMPDSDPLHADHCVQMALDMIEIIRNFREETRVNVDMRIGVHSGNVLSGLLGLRKWQFDIWSRDVMIASRMEQSGRPGCVHVSKATKNLLTREYNIEPGNGNIRDDYLSELDMETFFITPYKKQIKRDSLYVPVNGGSPNSSRRISSFSHSKVQRKLSSCTEILSSRRRTVLGFSLLQFRQMVSQVNEFMESAIDAMALSKKDQWLKPEGIQPLLLTFKEKSLELPFLRDKNALYKYSLLASFFVCLSLTVITALVKPRLNYYWAATACAFLVIVCSIFCSWLPVLWKKFKKSSSLPCLDILERASASVIVRTILFTTISIFTMILAMMGLEGCNNEEYSSDFTVNNTLTPDVACLHPWYFTWCAILCMISVSVFLRIHYFMKLIVNGSLVAVFCCIIHSRSRLFSKPYLQDWSEMPPGIDQYWCLFVILYILHLLDRQVEYIGRLDYLWKRKLKQEQEEATTMGLVNRTLLQNILPVHVAQYYLTKESMHLDLDLYHEEYSSVAVMFASIPNYMDFYSESLLNDEGRKCLQVLHEIICDFDKLLYEPQFLKLEKIKTIGSTYMAAAGLQPGRNSSRTSHESFGPEEDGTHNVMVMTKFAMAIMETLQEINKHTMQQFHLRIGIAMGPVLAGVVGASKPQYDIWGDTVNIASRMDSTGVVGAIQVTERVAEILKESNKYDVQCRGQIFIKGKGLMTTYLVYPAESTKL